MKLLLEMVITLLAGTWAVFLVIFLENLACWENKTIFGGAMKKGKPVSPLRRNGSRRYHKWTPSGSLPFLPFALLCGTKGSSSGCSSRWCYWQSAECLHRECHSHGRTASALQRQTQLFGTPSEERWFPHKGRMLNQKRFWKFALC